MLPHDWLVLHLTGAFVTDRSDASGTGYFSAVTNSYRPDLLERFFGTVPELPRVLAPDAKAGQLLPEWSGGGSAIPVSAGAGDNAAAALALELEPRDAVVSVGTSGTVFTRSPVPLADQTGLTAGFADAQGGHLPLLCTINAARVLTSTAALLGVDLAKFDALARSGPGDATGLTMLPYFDGERTPDLPLATGTLHGLTRKSFTPENLARAAVLAVANSLADCLETLRAIGAPLNRVLLIGGGAKSPALRSALADTIDMPVVIPEVGEYAAIGAARQAAWMVAARPPVWTRRDKEVVQPARDAGARDYRRRYGQLSSALLGYGLGQPGRTA
jgi:xylulokinase